MLSRRRGPHNDAFRVPCAPRDSIAAAVAYLLPAITRSNPDFCVGVTYDRVAFVGNRKDEESFVDEVRSQQANQSVPLTSVVRRKNFLSGD